MVLINYKLKEIFDPNILGLTTYYELIGICMETPEKIYSSPSLIEQLKDFMNFFTNKKWEYYDEYKVLYSLEESPLVVTNENLKFIFEIYKKMYGLNETLQKESDRDDVDEEMKEWLKLLEEEQSKVNKAIGSRVNLISIIQAFSCKHPSINLTNIWDYTLYQLYQSYKYINQIDEEKRLLSAYYAGVIKLKQEEVQALYWANEKN